MCVCARASALRGFVRVRARMCVCVSLVRLTFWGPTLLGAYTLGSRLQQRIWNLLVPLTCDLRSVGPTHLSLHFGAYTLGAYTPVGLRFCFGENNGIINFRFVATRRNVKHCFYKHFCCIINSLTTLALGFRLVPSTGSAGPKVALLQPPRGNDDSLSAEEP